MSETTIMARRTIEHEELGNVLITLAMCSYGKLWHVWTNVDTLDGEHDFDVFTDALEFFEAYTIG